MIQKTFERFVMALMVVIALGPAVSRADSSPCQPEVHQIAGYPEYGSDTSKLAPEQQAVIKELAKKVVASQLTRAAYTSFIIVGHADVALRVAPNQRASFENKVSEQRAEAAKRTLLAEIAALPDGKKLAEHLRFRTRGEGSTYRMVKPARTEAEMRLNRRVEIYTAQCKLPQPNQDDTLKTRIDRLLKLVASKGLPGAPEHRVKRSSCVLSTLQKPGAIDVFVDGRATSPNGVGKFPVINCEGKACYLAEWTGNYDTDKNPLPPTEVLKFLARIIPILEAEGFSPNQPDDHVLSLLNQVLERVDMGINQVDAYINRNPMVKPGRYSGDAVRKKLQTIYRNHLNDETNIYHCYK
jgi:outer membrane protein OmpA-like peptidoglycan-associated protein